MQMKETKNNKRLVIIPDVHGRGFWRDAVRDDPDGEFLFLGDYLDPYELEGISEAEAFRGLEDILEFKKENPDRVTLLSVRSNPSGPTSSRDAAISWRRS